MTHKPLYSIKEIAKLLKGNLINVTDPDTPISGVNIFPSQVKKGDVVFTINKEHWSKKYRFRETVDKINIFEKKGAALIITHKRGQDKNTNIPILLVEDSREALKDLAQNARSRLKSKVIAITGTAGKSSTREITKAFIKKSGSVYATEKNYNHTSGVELSLTRTPPDTNYAVYEFAVGHPSNTLERALMLKPDIAVITNIYADHLRFYDNLESLAKQKALLFKALADDGIAILNRDNEFFELLQGEALKYSVQNIITFGKHKNADIKLIDLTLDQTSSRVTARVCDKMFTYQISVPGLHNVMNSLTTLSIAYALGLDITNSLDAFDQIKIPSLRNQETIIDLPQGGSFTLIEDTFNSNSGSMMAAMELLSIKKKYTEGYLIAVLGQMHGMGRNSPLFHKQLAPSIIAAGIDKLFTVGENMKFLANELPQYIHAKHGRVADEIVELVVTCIRPGDIVFVKGWTDEREQIDIVSDALKNIHTLKNTVPLPVVQHDHDEIKGLDKLRLIEHKDIELFTNKFKEAQRFGKVSFFPFLLSYIGKNRYLLWEIYDNSLCVYVWRKHRKKLDIFLSPFPFSRNALNNAVQTVQRYNNSQTADILWIEEQDKKHYDSIPEVIVKNRRNEYIYRNPSIKNTYTSTKDSDSHHSISEQHLDNAVCRDMKRTDVDDCFSLLMNWQQSKEGIKGKIYKRKALDLIDRLPREIWRGQIIEANKQIIGFIAGGMMYDGIGQLFIEAYDSTLTGIDKLQRSLFFRSFPENTIFNVPQYMGNESSTVSKQTKSSLEILRIYRGIIS